MNIIYKIIIISLFIFAQKTPALAQNFDTFIQMSWDNNEQLKAHYFQLQAAEANLAEAKSMFGPTVVFGAQYTLATGGREINIPIGDLLNPVYSTLNQLTSSSSFPSVEDATISFLPNNFLDAKVRIQQPIYYPDLAINRKVKSKQIELKALEIKAYKRLLSKEVMTAYIQWQMSIKAIAIFKEADLLLQEAYRTTNSLYQNGKALPAALRRIQSEQSTLQAQLIAATNKESVAWQFLSFLLNDKAITRTQVMVLLDELPASIINGGEREELQQIGVGIAMQDLAIQKEKQFYLPRIGTQLDLGSQDFSINFKPYALFGINLEWNIYDHKRHTHRKNRAKAAMNAQVQQLSHLERQMALQNHIAKSNLESAIAQARTFETQIQDVKKTYKEVMIKYRSGTANYLELIDAQTQITQTDISYTLAQYSAWLKWADYLYVTASYPIQ